MARLHPVVTLPVYEKLVARKRLRVQGELVLEAKLDGYLAIGFEGRFYTGSGRRAPSWMKYAFRDLGIDAPRGSQVFFIEVYGSCATPGGYHRGDRQCYRAALVDAGRSPSFASGIEEAAFLARALDPIDKLYFAETYGLEHPVQKMIMADRAPESWELKELLNMFRSYEGYVLKLYRNMGHVLPPDYGAKIRGLLEVKVKHRPL
ncbi:hypothetical protein PYJP_16430 [Pyrofollis japonicus]|uniref:hypothetical protein n=1 Tax=Pyrofollis japonicus TaxID=3060460 RepID=UPI00295AAEE8|nr:hypothetical protein [Pyrofollis japonicus]BEP18291.1 hypothetical protein PYJP_16430 [Pyrofollis japonicus]